MMVVTEWTRSTILSTVTVKSGPTMVALHSIRRFTVRWRIHCIVTNTCEEFVVWGRVFFGSRTVDDIIEDLHAVRSAMSIAVPWELSHPSKMMLELYYDLIKERQAEYCQILLCVIAPVVDRLEEIIFSSFINKLPFHNFLASTLEIRGNICGSFETGY